jgi:ParB family chromosome partitioning protein
VADDQSMLEMALIENIQRRDLNAIEIAISYKRLLEECSLKQEELGDRVGKDRSTISNYLRLLKLPDEIQAGIRDGQITMGHARAIIGVDDSEAMMALFHQIINEQLSVRAVEEIVRNAGKERSATEKPEKGAKMNLSEFKNFQDTLARKLDTKVAFKSKSNGGGDLVISFENKNELIRILNLL